MESWALALIILAAVVVGWFVAQAILRAWAARAYKHILQNPRTACDIDAFVGGSDGGANPVSAVKVVLAQKIQIGSRRVASSDAIPLEVIDSPHVDGLRVSRKLTGTESAVSVDQLISESKADGQKKTPIVIATIRMGFGHHRLAYSAASWALQTGHPTIFHDLLSIESAESELIKSTDELYSKFSRMASEIGGPVEKLWGSAMMQGDADALRIAGLTAAHLQPLLLAYPKDTPIIATHQLCALTCAAAGFTNVTNLVVDNWPQWFLVVPRTLNIVQGPVNYQNFLRMGVQPKELEWTGHWCPADMVQSIGADCQRRIERAAAGRPVRVLVPVGGAGAQRKFIIRFVRALAPLVDAGRVQLLLNAGDHAHMKTAFLQVLDECGLAFDTVSTTEGVRAFQRRLLQSSAVEPPKNCTLFAFDEYFPAVAATDILCRVADVLSCKPSELAFYCVPKLHIRRVGDHEAASAKRSSELGDGTEEARELEDAMHFMKLFLASPDLLTSMNEAIVNNNKIGIYDGCRNAVDLSLKRAAAAEATESTTIFI